MRQIHVRELPKEKQRLLLVKLQEAADDVRSEMTTTALFLLGLCLGILGSLFADIIDAFIRGGDPYPLWYVILIVLLLTFFGGLAIRKFYRLRMQLEKTHKIMQQVKHAIE
jgi:hypothetical protein